MMVFTVVVRFEYVDMGICSMLSVRLRWENSVVATISDSVAK